MFSAKYGETFGGRRRKPPKVSIFEKISRKTLVKWEKSLYSLTAEKNTARKRGAKHSEQ